MIKKINLVTLSLFYLFILSSQEVKGQLNRQLNQYMVYQPLVNYAAASTYDQVSCAAYYRNQWLGFNGSPEGFGAQVAIPFTRNHFSVGLGLNKDKIGVHNNDAIELNYAYWVRGREGRKFAVSLSPQLRVLSGDYSQVTSTDLADPILYSSYSNVFLPNVKLGAYYSQNRFYIGLATPGLFKNNQITNTSGQSFSTQFDYKNLGWFIHSGTQIELTHTDELAISALIKENSGAAMHAEINAMWLAQKGKFGFGLSYRTSKDLVGIFQMGVLNNFRFSYAYQASLSGLRTHQMGTHELMLIYEIPSKLASKIIIPRF